MDPFEDHVWKDVVSPEDLELYQRYRRELRVGQRPAVLLIDLYNQVYKGGPARSTRWPSSTPAPAATTPGMPSSPPRGC